MLEITGVSRSFGEKRALTDVSFTVGAGRLTGFVGGNGAGKTTTMRIILGVLSADAGDVSLDGQSLRPDDRRRFGYMPEERGLYPKMKVAEQLVYLARLHGLSPTRARTNATTLLEQLDLAASAAATVESLSLGNQQRAQIAAALVHDPEVLVLDEPFSGLDPIAVDSVMGVLTARAAAGAPVLFSSHQLDIVERLCDDVVVIAGGSIRASGTREGLRAEHSGNSFELVTDAPGSKHTDGISLDWVGTISGVTVVEASDGRVEFAVTDENAAQVVLRRAASEGTVVSFRRLQPSLAQIFREVVQ
jgi:ABC-2 type transport system ATP-binding protein